MKKLPKYLIISLSLTILLAVGSCSDDDKMFEPQNATLTYNTNGAENGTAPDVVIEEIGTIVTLDDGNGFSRNGFTFAGWNTSANGTGTDYAAGSTYTITNNVVLYAKWVLVSSSNKMKITVGSSTFTALLATNTTATAFREFLPMTVNMTEHAGNEKFYNLSQAIPSNHTNPGIIQNGDIMLYGSSTLVLFYKTFSTSYSYTRIGNIDDPSGLQNALGGGSITVTFEMSE